jgi:hypothetical protein
MYLWLKNFKKEKEKEEYFLITYSILAQSWCRSYMQFWLWNFTSHIGGLVISPIVWLCCLNHTIGLLFSNLYECYHSIFRNLFKFHLVNCIFLRSCFCFLSVGWQIHISIFGIIDFFALYIPSWLSTSCVLYLVIYRKKGNRLIGSIPKKKNISL